MDPALAQIIDRIRAAAADRSLLRLRGGGTKDFHAPVLAGQVLDTRSLSGIVSYEPSELVVTVGAGTPLAELEAVLAERGQCLPFEPPHFGPGATVGGMVAAGLSGPARASVGAVRDFVLGVVMVNGQAQVLTYGGQVMKNVAGYDVSRLMAGSWGTLGLIAEVSLKVLPVAPGEATLRFACDAAEAVRRLNAWGGQPLPLHSSCWVHEAGQGTLYVRLRGAVAAVEAACRSLGGERLDAESVAPDWTACREQTLPWFADRAPHHGLWRLSLPPTAPALALPGGSQPLIEWHGAQRWVQAPMDAGPALQATARELGGSASLFIAAGAYPQSVSGTLEPHLGPSGGGWSAVPAAVPTLAPAVLQIHQRLQRSFDPAGIFNTGRMAWAA